MTEEEKIFAGKMFSARTPELLALKHKAHSVCQRFNAMDEYDPERQPLIKEFIGHIGTHYHFQGPLQFNYGCHTFIGNHFFANFNLMIMDDARIYIGNNVAIGPNVSLLATTHPLLAQERLGLDEDGCCTAFAEYAEEIHIGDNVWLAANVCVLGGVNIGTGAVIGAGSVVTRDIPAGYVAAGNPCRPLRPISASDSKKALFLPEDTKRFWHNLR